MMAARLLVLLTLFRLSGMAQTTPPPISVHDPVIIRQDSTYYIFATGRGITVWSSKNRVDWNRAQPVFAVAPNWTTQLIPQTRPNDLWAPDISFYNGYYCLFYSSSVFGKNNSAIGLAINKTLNPASPDFKWQDQGMVIRSIPGEDKFNAIDPNLIVDEQGKPWLTFGSFWHGIKLVPLSADLKTVTESKPWPTIASRPYKKNPADSTISYGAIEAPFLFKKGKYYYLFTSWDLCCRGPQSTYKMMVGRALKLTGPYVDRNGIPLEKGGGSLVLSGDTNWYGVGHNAVATFDGRDYLVFHAYDAGDNGRSKLRIEQLEWDKGGWPVIVN